MDELAASPLKKFNFRNTNTLYLGILAVAIVVGVVTGYLLSHSSGAGGSGGILSTPPKSASADTKTFRDFAEGVIQKKPAPKNPGDYTEGTHILIRDNVPAHNATLTSSVVDLSQYEGKRVKVYGETQKALKEGWLMDVGKVQVE